MIMHEVRKHHTSAARFNARLKLQLLLEPLSYRVDVRRLHDMAAATGTVWDFTAVQAWRALPPGGAGRVLCVAAGAGEGKSTISAALCGAAGGGLVAAHHFLKYNDQRRLEPLRIIKSLAFQLAERCVGRALTWGLDLSLMPAGCRQTQLLAFAHTHFGCRSRSLIIARSALKTRSAATFATLSVPSLEGPPPITVTCYAARTTRPLSRTPHPAPGCPRCPERCCVRTLRPWP